MASKNYRIHFLDWKLITFTLLCVLCSSCLADDSCPTHCECKEIGKLSCELLPTLDKINNRSLYHTLTVKNHTITELKAGDFAGFTKLEQLDLSDGWITSIAPGTFNEVNETIVRIILNHNKLAEVKSGVFKGLTKLDELELIANHLEKLDENAFENLPELVTLKLNANLIDKVDKNALKDLPKLENLNFNYNHLKLIPASAVDKLSALRELDLGFNKIETIPEDSNLLLPVLESIILDSNPLTTLTSFPAISMGLKSLNLQFTHLNSISKATWKNVPEINQLFLSGTNLKSLDAGMFEGLNKLNKLYIRDMPKLETIGPDAFKGLANLARLDVANSKKLTHIAEDAFKSTNITFLFASGCALPMIQENLLPWDKMKVFMIYDNPINCDCHMKWITKKDAFKNNSLMKESFGKLLCDLPKSLKYTNVTSLHADRFVCFEKDDHVKRLATGVIVVIICLLFFAILGLIIKFRKRITISCRKYYQYRRYKNDLVFTVEHDTSVAELDDGDFDGRPLKEMRLEM